MSHVNCSVHCLDLKVFHKKGPSLFFVLFLYPVLLARCIVFSPPLHYGLEVLMPMMLLMEIISVSTKYSSVEFHNCLL